jgi:hypothetical protein
MVCGDSQKDERNYVRRKIDSERGKKTVMYIFVVVRT